MRARPFHFVPFTRPSSPRKGDEIGLVTHRLRFNSQYGTGKFAPVCVDFLSLPSTWSWCTLACIRLVMIESAWIGETIVNHIRPTRYWIRNSSNLSSNTCVVFFVSRLYSRYRLFHLPRLYSTFLRGSGSPWDGLASREPPLPSL